MEHKLLLLNGNREKVVGIFHRKEILGMTGLMYRKEGIML